jgi:hypothetical protein
MTGSFYAEAQSKDSGSELTAVVFNMKYAYPRGYAKTSYGACKTGEKILFRDKH